MGLVVLEVDDEAGGFFLLALVSDDEAADALARGPGVDEIGGAAVEEADLAGENLGVGAGNKKGGGDGREGILAIGDGDEAGVTGGGEGGSEAADVVKAVGGEVAVIDEEDVHARKIKMDRGRRSMTSDQGLIPH